MIYKFLCLFLVCFQYVFGTFEVEFWDVGQGNCTIVNCPGGHPLLIDAGSREGRPKAKIAEEVSGRLSDLIPEPCPPDMPHLSVFVTHGDSDHMDCIEKIIAKLKEEKADLRIQFLLGGRPEHYSGTSKRSFMKLVEKYRKYSLDKKIYISEHIAAGTDPRTLSLHSGDVEVKLLAALDHEDPNTSSLVLKLIYDGKSVLLTGDATGETMATIPPAELKAHVYQAAHHGADTDDSNSEQIIGHVSPSFAILSAGDHQGDQHPKFSVVERLLMTGTLVDTGQFHKVRFHQPLLQTRTSMADFISKLHVMEPSGCDFRPYLREKSEYLWASTSLGLYGTHGYEQGKVTLSVEAGKDIVVDHGPELSNFSSSSSHIISSLKRLPRPFQRPPEPHSPEIEALDLSRLGLIDLQVKQILARMTSAPAVGRSLSILNLKGNQLATLEDETLGHLASFPLLRLDFRANPSLTDPVKQKLEIHFRERLAGLFM